MDVDVDAASPAIDANAAAAFAQALTPSANLFDVSALAGAAIPSVPSLQQTPAPEQTAAASPLAAFTAPAATPAEVAAANETFAPLPSHIKSRFRNDAFGDLLWFTAPAAEVPVVTRPAHSLEYLYWKAQQKAKQQGVAA